MCVFIGDEKNNIQNKHVMDFNYTGYDSVSKYIFDNYDSLSKYSLFILKNKNCEVSWKYTKISPRHTKIDAVEHTILRGTIFSINYYSSKKYFNKLFGVLGNQSDTENIKYENIKFFENNTNSYITNNSQKYLNFWVHREIIKKYPKEFYKMVCERKNNQEKLIWAMLFSEKCVSWHDYFIEKYDRFF